MDLGKLSELSQWRVCKECGPGFEVRKEESVLKQFSNHTIIHNPKPEAWVEAHRRIEAGKERAKSRQ